MSDHAAPGPVPPSALTVEIAALRRRGVMEHRFAADLDPTWVAGALGQAEIEVESPVRVEITLWLPPDGALVGSGHALMNYRMPCARCLADAFVSSDVELSGTFVEGDDLPAPSGVEGFGDDEPGVGLSAEDLDVWAYDGRILHLEAWVAEHLRLAVPMRALCERGESCRGLCDQCGADLNETADGTCPRCGGIRSSADSAASGDPPDNPFRAALKKLSVPD